ncbi:hypothetical protein LWI29_031622 [Acer saccharum]|uniref:Amidase domain-containing protein n=1 Tax=Acer saccharum TaxID=4024 RepID=A0AA39S147_ACESA|nr:hypothetical protein LWI29_031622 [Acer saccharum]
MMMMINRQTCGVAIIAIAIAAAIQSFNPVIKGGEDFTFLEATIDEIQAAFAENKLTSRQLVEFYITQIENLNPRLKSVLEVNPDARNQADEADLARKRRSRDDQGRRSLGKLHGVPVLLKDTIATKDKLNTTAGSYALVGSVVGRDATVVERLRDAGAVIWGKLVSLSGTRFDLLEKSQMGGVLENPYLPSGDPCGSSSGSAISVAANMVAVSLGSETHGSILCPADHNSVVGFKPTVGLTSRAGVIPVLPIHDTIGPISRTVSDAVYLLDLIVGFDPRDYEATSEAAKFIPVGGYKQFLNRDGLKGKRLGVVRNLFNSRNVSTMIPAFEHHLNTLRKSGATIVDNLEISNVDVISNPSKNGELTAMLAGFKTSVNDYLKDLVSSPVRSLADIIAFNQKNSVLENIKEYGQDTFISSEKTSGFGEKERKAVELMEKLSRDGIEKLMTENKLDATVTPGTHFISVLAIGGYPGITVPAGYDSNGMPFGLCFGGLKGTEPKLIEVAYAFEQATLVRKQPPLSKSIGFTEENLFQTLSSVSSADTSPALSIREATVADLQLAFKKNQLTSRQVVEFYLGEIGRLNPILRGVIEVNPDALHLADKADQECKAKAPSSLLLGLHKDNIATKDKMNTTAGSFALLGSIVPRNAFVVTKLINAFEASGLISENPYVLLADPCGSSSGSAISVAANMAAVSLGTETDGSILCPSSYNSGVGIKPTVGLNHQLRWCHPSCS